MLKFPFLVVLLVAAAVGCAPAESDDAPPPKAEVAFEGKPDPALVGTWKTTDNMSIYTLKEDGSYRLQSKITVQGRKIDSDVAGQWSVSNDRFLMKATNGVAAYTFQLNGSTLQFSTTGSIKRTITLKKQ